MDYYLPLLLLSDSIIKEQSPSITSLPLNITSSEHSSIKEIWKLLEQDESISLQSTVEESELIPVKLHNDGEENEFGVVGVAVMGAQRQPPSTKGAFQSTNIPRTQSKKHKKIRNYNVRK